MADYIFLSRKELGKMPARPAMVKSIVTTGMQDKVAALYGVECLECLTGFKWIADLMRQSDEGKIPQNIIFGDEESYGYLVENEVRDKDGVSAAAMAAEMTLYWRGKGKSLLGRLGELYAQVGYWEEMGVSKYFKGPEGPGVMAGIMAEYRKKPPALLGGLKVEKVRDLLESISYSPSAPSALAAPGKKEAVALPKSDVLQFYLADGTIVSARPSGTEPKIKFYASSCTPLGTAGLAGAKTEAAKKLAAIKADIRAVIGE
jgi:phosphoglucomutase